MVWQKCSGIRRSYLAWHFGEVFSSLSFMLDIGSYSDQVSYSFYQLHPVFRFVLILLTTASAANFAGGYDHLEHLDIFHDCITQKYW